MMLTALLALLLLCAHVHRSWSFVAPSPSAVHRPPSTSISAAASATASSATAQSTRETSDELLRLLQSKAASKASASDDEINSLARTLIASKSPFDPSKCIDGPLFATVHFIGDTPLWERIGVGGRNVKGQKYTLGNGDAGTFTNYAEIVGDNCYLMATGNCKAEGPVSLSSSGKESEGDTSNNPLFGALASLFDSKTNRQSELLPTPYDYSATVTGASLVLFQTFSLDLSIEGTGTVRVLYADENLRIFLSPTDTNVTKGVGDWENEGLVVVQVRSDLVYDDWVDRL